VLMCDRILVFSTNPAQIVSEIKVDLPQPRNRLDPSFRDLVERIYVAMTERPAEATRAVPPTERFPKIGTDTVLPRVSANLLSGLIEAGAWPPLNGEAGLPDIATSPHLEMEHLCSVGQTLPTLPLAVVRESDLP